MPWPPEMAREFPGSESSLGWYVAEVQVRYCNISWEDCKTSFQGTCFITKVNSISPSGFSTDICY